MMRRQFTQWNALAAVVILALAWSGTARAENAVRFSDGAGEPGGTATVDVIVDNDLTIAGVDIHFHWSSPDLSFDSISFIRDRYLGSLNGLGGLWSAADRIGRFRLIGSLSDTAQRGLINAGSGAVARIWFHVSPQASSQWVTIDTVYANKGDPLQPPNFSDVSGLLSIWPNIYPGTITIGHPSGQASMAVVPDHLEFHGARGGPALPTQSVSIRSIGSAPFTWTASSAATWLHVSPSSGNSPGELAVGADPGDLDPGDYLDTILVSSPEAINSPLRLPVALRIEGATDLGTSPGRLDFQTVRHGPNPQSQTLHLESSNGVSLAWSATWGSAWLTVNPSSGDQLGSTQASVSAAEMDTGRYVDTIVITAPGAVNSPLKIPVSLFIDTTASIPPPNALHQNHPNPFSTYHDPLTSISYTMEKSGHVEITLYDILGRRVKRLVSDNLSAGEHVVLWDGRDDRGRTVASGHYFYRMKTAGSTVTRRMVVIK